MLKIKITLLSLAIVTLYGCATPARVDQMATQKITETASTPFAPQLRNNMMEFLNAYYASQRSGNIDIRFYFHQNEFYEKMQLAVKAYNPH